ncbi:MAG: AEC family transporter [Propionibacterium sp.]|nr:AEC family transporter [Propionibacterium sp.]
MTAGGTSLLSVLSATGPIFIVVTLGFLLTRFGLFRRADMSVFSTFVVKIALPVLIFVNIYGRPATDIFQPTFLLTYAGAAMVMFAIAQIYRRIMGRGALRAAIMGLGMGGTNNGFIGLPIFLILFADWAGIAVGMAMLVDNILIIPLALFLIGHAAGEGTVVQRLLETVKGVVTHPMVIAIILALLLNSLGIELPTVVERSTGLLAQASTGVALFSVGGMLVGLDVKGAVSDIVMGVAGKLVVMPAVAIGLLGIYAAVGLPDLPNELRAAAVLTCALPPFSILPALAEPYGEADVATATMMLSTVLSFVTLSGWMLVLTGMGWL